MSNTKKRLVASLMQFLTDELSSEELSPDSKDSIEVAIQCLETAYEINPVDGTLPSKKPILEIFASYLKNEEVQPKKVISEEDKAKANELKNAGNDLIKAGKYSEAVEAYTKAIELDETNPIFYSNRAAAYSKLNNHEKALEDCKIAIKHDPTYSKAYCRMGFAYVSLNDHQRARDAYKKAVELDPSETNHTNLKLAEQKLEEQKMEEMGGGLGGLGNIFRNPQIMNMANQLMTDPNMQNMFAKLINPGAAAAAAQTDQSTNQSGDQAANPSSNTTPFDFLGQMGQQFMGSSANADQSDQNNQASGASMDPNQFSAFLQMGQQFAEQMRSSNPELIEQLKKAMGDKNDGQSADKNPEN